MRRIFVARAVVTGCLAAALLGGQLAMAEDGDPITIEVDGDRLHLTLDNADLSAVMDQLAEQFAFTVDWRSSAPIQRSGEREGDLTSVLRWLLKGANSAVFVGDDDQGVRRVLRVVVTGPAGAAPTGPAQTLPESTSPTDRGSVPIGEPPAGAPVPGVPPHDIPPEPPSADNPP